MTTEELVSICVQAINAVSETGIPPRISLEMPPGNTAKYRRLSGDKGPTGRIVKQTADADIVIFDARQVLAWMVATGAIKYKSWRWW